MYETLQDIELLLSRDEESANLDFKSGRFFTNINANEAKSDLIKDVTAFANAGGGTIVFGIAERQEGGRCIADRLEPVLAGSMTKDRLAQILNAHTDPPLIDFQIRIIDCPGGSVYVLHIDEGHTAFQNRFDKKYYQRVEATTQAMYGYAIRDVMNRRTGAVVLAKLDVQFEQSGDNQRYRIIPRLENIGALTANHWILEVDLPVTPSELHVQAPHLVIGKGSVALERWAFQRVEFSSERAPPTISLRLLPGTAVALSPQNGFLDLRFEMTTNIGRQIRRDEPPIRWTLFVDNAARRSDFLLYGQWSKY